MLLRLTDGTTTLTLSGAGAYLGATYFPSNQSGGDRISEAAPLILEGTEAEVRAAVNAVDLLLRGAGDARRRGMPVYVEFRPTDSGEIRRSEIYDGFCNWAQPPAERYLYGAVNTVRVVANWERTATWQGPEEELYLSSATLTERTGGVTAYNNDNATTSNNWVQMLAARVKGTRPAPIRLRITNAAGSALAWRRFYIGLNAFSAPTSADLWLLGSEAAAGASASWGAGATHNDLQWVFPLSATLLGQAGGRTFRVIAAFTSLTSTANVRAAVGTYISSLYVPQRAGVERAGTRRLLDLGEFPVPPGGYAVANASAALAITVRSSASGSGTINFVMLMPTDGYRRLEQVGYTISNGASIEDNEVDGGAYLLSGSDRYPIVKAAGEGLNVYPGRDQRLYILFDEDGAWTAGRQMTVRAWYRPVYDNV